MNIEKLAEIQHEIWSDWMKYLFSKCRELFHAGANDKSMGIPGELVRRWKKQMNIEYKDLSEEEKESDRRVVRNYYI